MFGIKGEVRLDMTVMNSQICHIPNLRYVISQKQDMTVANFKTCHVWKRGHDMSGKRDMTCLGKGI